MYTPPRATATPTGVILRRTRLPFFYTLLLLLPLVLLFATAQAASAVDVCTTDTAGANDEPGQKDLTTLCSDDAGLPSTLAVKVALGPDRLERQQYWRCVRPLRHRWGRQCQLLALHHRLWNSRCIPGKTALPMQ